MRYVAVNPIGYDEMANQALWPAFIGYALGSAQILGIDWIRNRVAHRRHLRLLRAELRRLAGFSQKWGWQHHAPPPDDKTPNPPRITKGYERLLQDIDFWLTDEHADDNTQQGLIDIADGAVVLEHYVAAVHEHVAAMKAAGAQSEKTKYLTRAIDTAQVYDKELDRWRTVVGSALIDVERRLRIAGIRPQLRRVLQAMPEGNNPPSLPPVDHPPSAL